MNREQVIHEITSIAKDIFQKDDLEFSNELNANSFETWTSLNFMQFLSEIELKFNFKFKMMELIKLKNMGAVVDAVLAHVDV